MKSIGRSYQVDLVVLGSEVLTLSRVIERVVLLRMDNLICAVMYKLIFATWCDV